MAWESDYRYEPNSLFEHVFRCLPFSQYKNPQLQTGDKIIMPPSSLDRISHLPIRYPLLFKIESRNSDKTSHCGVLQFDAEEGFVYMPDWMMENLNVGEGDCVILKDAMLSRGLYMKLQPHSSSFTNLTNVKVVLEKTLRDFSCVSRGDTIMVKHNEKDFYFDVLEVKPGNAISLIETDCMVDFAPPLDSEEFEKKEQKMEEVDLGEEEEIEKVDHGEEKEFKKVDGGEKGEIKKVDHSEKEEEGKVFRPFTGMARRLDGDAVAVPGGGCSAEVGRQSKVVVEEGKKSKKDGGKDEVKEKFKPFTGRGCVLGGL